MTARVVVVGLGPGDPGLISVAARAALEASDRRFLRTTRHPSAFLAEPAASFDWIYDQAETMEEVYTGIVEALVAEAASGEVLYAVPGSPLVAERTVELLRADPRVELSVVASMSFLDLAWDRLGIDPVVAGVRLVDGHRFARSAAGRSGPFLVGQCDTRLVLSDIKLAVDDGPEVTLLQRLGLPDERVERVAWAELDRAGEADHLTSLYIPALGTPPAAEVGRLVDLVGDLRQRCAWDRQQTHASLARHLVEETYEVLDAISGLERGEGYAPLEEELGDLLFQVVFHAGLAAEQGQFELADVARAVHDKLVERHPHLFGDGSDPAPDWEEHKRAAKGRASVMDGAATDLPALLLAWKVQSKAASTGVQGPPPPQLSAQIAQRVGRLAAVAGAAPDEAAAGAELGDALFAVVALARHAGVDPEMALRAAAGRFADRFRAAESRARGRGVVISDRLWEEAQASPRP